MDVLLTAAEAARVFGVSAKALRVYEARGLLRPPRTASGWRLYGAAEAARVQEIRLLQSLGLSLSVVGTLLKGRHASVERTLALQQDALERRLEQIQRAIRLIAKARTRAQTDQSVSPAELLALLKGDDEPDWEEVIERFYARHLDYDDWEVLAGDFGPDEWDILIDELKALTAAAEPPDSHAAQTFFARWVASAHQITTDPGLHRRLSDAWREAVADPIVGTTLPLGPGEIDYLAALAQHAAVGVNERA